jgi:hypothetical protein
LAKFLAELAKKWSFSGFSTGSNRMIKNLENPGKPLLYLWRRLTTSETVGWGMGDGIKWEEEDEDLNRTE